MHREKRECVAVKMVSTDQTGGGLSPESLRKEVSNYATLTFDLLVVCINNTVRAVLERACNSYR